MAPAINPLGRFSVDQLLEELSRRRQESAERRPIIHCDTCANFITKADADDNYNPCSKGHKMSFRMPDGLTFPNPEEWGYYKAVCIHREILE